MLYRQALTIVSRPTHGVFRCLRAALDIYRQRQHLLLLDAHLLRDIGLTRRDAQTEAARSVWDAPDFWVKSCN